MRKNFGKLMLAAGATLLIVGVADWLGGKPATPVDVSLADLEAGRAPAGSHWKIGQHVALMDRGAFAYDETPLLQPKTPPDIKTNVFYAYYPIISEPHPYMTAPPTRIDAGDHVVTLPAPLGQFAVLVKTTKYRWAGQLVPGWFKRKDVEGVVISRGSSLSGKEREFLSKNTADVKWDQVWVLEQGRMPWPISRLTMVGVGAASFIGGLMMIADKEDEAYMV